MEHEDKLTTRALLARYIRRRWKTPAKVMGGIAVVGVLMGTVPVKFKPGARPQPIPTQVTASGVVESIAAKGVGPVFDGTVAQVAVERGQQVKKGQPLFKMDTTSLLSDLASAKQEQILVLQAYNQARANRAADLAVFRQGLKSMQQALHQERAAARQWKQSLKAAQNSVDPYATAYGPQLQMEYDYSRAQVLEAQVADARRQMSEKAASWQPVLKSLEEQSAETRKRVRDLTAQINAAVRTSPIDGVVTMVYAVPGRFVPRKHPVVRVDDPQGYRVVALVDSKLREPLKPGLQLTYQDNQAAGTGKLEKIVSGWDDQLFQYYVWVKPERVDGLEPGERVRVTVPTKAALVTASAQP